MNLDDVTACFNLVTGVESSMPERANFWLNGAGKARAHAAIMSACTAYTNAMGQLDKAARRKEMYTDIYLAHRLRQVSARTSSCVHSRPIPIQTQIIPLTPMGQNLFVQFQRPVWKLGKNIFQAFDQFLGNLKNGIFYRGLYSYRHTLTYTHLCIW